MTSDTERAEHKAPRKPWLLEFRSSDGFILATVCVAIFTVRIRWIGAPTYATLTATYSQDAFLYGVVCNLPIHVLLGSQLSEYPWPGDQCS